MMPGTGTRANVQGIIGEAHPVMASGREPLAIESIAAGQARTGGIAVCIVTATRGSRGWSGVKTWSFTFSAGAKLASATVQAVRGGKRHVPPCRIPGLVLDLAITKAMETSNAEPA